MANFYKKVNKNNEVVELLENPIIENHEGLIEINREEFEELVYIKNNPPKTIEQLEGEYKNLIQGYLDATANSWGYDSIYTAIGYIGDPNDTFNKEGLMFRNWRSAVWTYVNEELAKLKQGLRTMPTEEEAIAELPLLDTYRIEQGL